MTDLLLSSTSDPNDLPNIIYCNMSAKVGQCCKKWEPQLQVHNVVKVTKNHTHTHSAKLPFYYSRTSVCLSVCLFILLYSVDILNKCTILLYLGGNCVLKKSKVFVTKKLPAYFTYRHANQMTDSLRE